LLSEQSTPVITLDPSLQLLTSYGDDDLDDDTLLAELAYVIFTSGSTGKPKGAMITHQGMLNHLCVKIDDLAMSAADRVAQTASHCFDISVWQFLSALLVGGQVHIFSHEITHQPELLLEQMQHDAITIIELVPALLKAMLDMAGSPFRDMRRDMRHLRWLVATGEALPADLCRRWFQMAGAIPLVNAYGPTECSDDVTHCIVRDERECQGNNIPIGRPVANTQIYILDEQLAPVPVGIAGQLYVGGIGVGRGYLADPVRTAAAFLPDPFSGDEGNRIYRTGDIARYLVDGKIEFLGRIDHQVKLRGFRIELGEIEAALLASPQVLDTIVVIHESQAGQKRLVAYVVAQTGVHLSIGELRRSLKERLPEYMVPSAFVEMPALPLTPNGKINRRALPEPEEQRPDLDVFYVPAVSTIERTIARIWQEVLQVEKVGMHDNFFDLGGHSLLMVQIHRKLCEALTQARSLSMVELFQYPTISALAESMGQSGEATTALPSPSIGQHQAQSRKEAMKRQRSNKTKH
jgi:amino acid adenylation domain-containing protein